jgi:hypothetical protein
MGIAGINYNNNQNKMSSGVIEENIDIENISSSQKSKDYSNKKSGSFNNFNNINNIQSNINNIPRASTTMKLPPINHNNQNQISYSIKEDIEGSISKSKSRIGTASKKTNDNNNIINKSNNKFNNINYGDKDDDEYGDGDFENNVSSLNQNSVINSNKKQTNAFGKIKNQNEASMSIQEEIDKHNRLGYNDKESSESYNDFENTKGLIKKGINFEGSGNFNNVNKFKGNNKVTNTQESEIKEEIEYGE